MDFVSQRWRDTRDGFCFSALEGHERWILFLSVGGTREMDFVSQRWRDTREMMYWPQTHCFFSSQNAKYQHRKYSSVQNALGKAHMRSTPSFRRFPEVAFETVPMFVCID